MSDNVNPDEISDMAIIGGGPVGQYAAYYAGLRGMKTKVIDSLPQLGGQLSALYPEKYIFDVAGYAKVYARDLVENLTEQMMQYEPDAGAGREGRRTWSPKTAWSRWRPRRATPTGPSPS